MLAKRNEYRVFRFRYAVAGGSRTVEKMIFANERKPEAGARIIRKRAIARCIANCRSKMHSGTFDRLAPNLVRVSLADRVAEQFVVLRKFRGRTDHFMDIESWRLQVETEPVEGHPRFHIHFRIVDRHG
jgi:hypothetical protein